MEIVDCTYGTSKTFDLPFVTYGATDFVTGVILAAGDVQISKDNGAFANIATLPTINGAWMEVTLSATEMQAERIKVQVIDQTATKIFEDNGATLTTELINKVWDEPLTGATHNDPTSSGRRLRSLGDVVSGSVDDVAATTTTFITDLAGAQTDHYSDQTIYFTSGVLTGMSRPILEYNDVTKLITIDEALPVAPSNGDAFDIDPVHIHPVSQIVQAIYNELITSTNYNIKNSAGKIIRELKEIAGYEGGFIYYDSVGGTAGNENFINGILETPVNNEADLLILKASLGIDQIKITPGSTLTLSASHEKQGYIGESWSLNLASQSVSGSYFHGATANGICTGVIPPKFEDCKIVNITPPPSGYYRCGFAGTFTAGAAGDYFFVGESHSGIAGILTPSWDYNSIGGVNFNFRGYPGGIEIQNMQATDNLSFDGDGQLKINANCNNGGTIRLAGHQIVTGAEAFIAAGGIIQDDARFATDQVLSIGDITGEIQNGVFVRVAVTGEAIQIIEGNIKTISIDLGVEWNLTGKLVYFVMKRSNSNDAAIVNRLATITDAINGVAEIDLLATETTPKGCYEYQVELRDDPAGTNPETAMEGTAEITENLRS